jgi:maleate isomerase
MSGADALFISCTALPALEILDEVEKKINKPVFSSNQTLIWDTIRSVGYKKPIDGYGQLFKK